MKSHFNLRRCVLAASLIAAVALVTLVVLPAVAEGSSSNHLVVDVVASTAGPLPACSQDGSNCGLANTVRQFVYVSNTNSLPTMRPVKFPMLARTGPIQERRHTSSFGS